MLKRKKDAKNIINVFALLIVLVILFLTIGYSAFQSSGIISDITATVRPDMNIKITDVQIEGTSEAIVVSKDYNTINSNNNTYTGKLISDLTFTNTNSSVTYKVEVTNFGNTEMGISSISGLPNNLTYELDTNTYDIGEKICDSTNTSKCTLGAKKSIYITIKYKSGSGTNTNTNLSLNLDLTFKEIHNIYYGGNAIGYVIDGGNKTVSLGSNAPDYIQVAGTYSSHSYTNPNVTINGVTSDIYITIKASSGGKLSDKIVNLISSETPDANGIYTPTSGTGCTNKLKYDGTTDNNLRYVGSNPCNYVTFNGETWRIIGVFNNVGSEPLVKIVNATAAYSTSVKYNNSNANGKNKWGTNSLYTSMSTTSAATNSMTQSVEWNIGGPADATNTALEFYNMEIATKSSSLPIGLISVSDYGFATDNPSACASTNLGNWNVSNCSTNHDWLFFSNDGNSYTVTSVTGRNTIFRIQTGRTVYATTITTNSAARAVVYLKANVLYDSGDGSSGSPYTLKMN